MTLKCLKMISKVIKGCEVHLIHLDPLCELTEGYVSPPVMICFWILLGWSDFFIFTEDAIGHPRARLLRKAFPSPLTFLILNPQSDVTHGKSVSFLIIHNSYQTGRSRTQKKINRMVYFQRLGPSTWITIKSDGGANAAIVAQGDHVWEDFWAATVPRTAAFLGILPSGFNLANRHHFVTNQVSMERTDLQI